MQQLVLSYQTIQGDGVIELRFNNSFDQMDIAGLAASLISKLDKAKLIEHVEGVDRECFRLDFIASEVNLNFEIYSQSCWFEMASAEDVSVLNEINTLL